MQSITIIVLNESFLMSAVLLSKQDKHVSEGTCVFILVKQTLNKQDTKRLSWSHTNG